MSTPADEYVLVLTVCHCSNCGLVGESVMSTPGRFHGKGC